MKNKYIIASVKIITEVFFVDKYSKEFLKETIEVWQPFCDVPLSSNDAIEITENLTALFNILITEDKKCNNKSIIKNNTYTKNKISKEVKKCIK